MNEIQTATEQPKHWLLLGVCGGPTMRQTQATAWGPEMYPNVLIKLINKVNFVV